MVREAENDRENVQEEEIHTTSTDAFNQEKPSYPV